MKNILLISAVFPPEPVVSAQLSNDIAVTLAENNFVTVISPLPSRPFGFQFSAETHHKNFKHIQSNSFVCASSNILGRFKESYSFGKHCQKYIAINHEKINVIYANTWPLLAQYFTVRAAKKFKVPLIIHVQDVYPESLSNKIPFLSWLLKLILLPLDKYILHNTIRIFAISNKMKNYLVKTRKTESGKIVVVQNWQDENTFIDIEFRSSNTLIPVINRPFTFMYLGNIGPVAGVDFLLEAFSKTNLDNSRLVIAGSGSMKKTLQKKVTELGLRGIEFWDVPNGKVPEIQNQAHVMLLPVKKGAASSSVPSKLPAYMFSKKPIITCVDEDSETAFAIVSSNCGWVLPPENIISLSNKLREVKEIQQDDLLILGINGYNYAIENLSKKNNLEKITSIINSIQ
jgi:glycosyltransferase involved in cell wall biosynthesis